MASLLFCRLSHLFVIIIDQDKANEQVFKELLQPLISQLDIELKKEGIHDTDYHIIGYGGAYEKKPYHYTMDGKQNNIQERVHSQCAIFKTSTQEQAGDFLGIPQAAQK